MKLDGQDVQLLGAAGGFLAALLVIIVYILFSHRAEFRG
jgi:hypothetical protein